MNRVIKFRQYAMGKMFYWGFGVGGDESHFSGPVSGSGVLPHKSPQMQFTGLTDANGVKVFDGDVIADEEGYLSKIYWSEKDFMWCVSDIGGLCELIGSDFKVVGNIYEHAHLLKSDN